MTTGQWIRAGGYVGALLMMSILMIRARKESLFTEEPVLFLLAPFRRSAVRVYRDVLRHRERRQQGSRGRSILLSEQARSDIAILGGKAQSDRAAAIYIIDKIQTLLLCLYAGSLLGVLLFVRGQQGGILEGTSIARPPYTAGDTTVRLAGTAQGESSEYDVTISERQYTSEETERLFETFKEVMPERILGENKGAHCIRTDLVLRASYEDYPFRFTYMSSNYAILHDDGTVHNEDLEENDEIPVTLTVKAAYKGRAYRTEIALTVLPMERTVTQQFEEAVRSALTDADADTIYSGRLYLPERVAGIHLEWSEPVQDYSLLLFVLVLITGGIACYMQDRQLRERVIRRERQLRIDYPQVVSKVTLFLGAGMSARNVFYKLSEDYRLAVQNGKEARYVYEEIVLTCRELDSGVPEVTAYRNLATRCRLRSYTKFISLLTQNLQKGNGVLLTALEDEAAAAFEERKSLARQLGEEAGTRMLLPMMLMLIITLVIIVVPAYRGFL